jgi:hypothetical protein
MRKNDSWSSLQRHRFDVYVLQQVVNDIFKFVLKWQFQRPIQQKILWNSNKHLPDIHVEPASCVDCLRGDKILIDYVTILNLLKDLLIIDQIYQQMQKKKGYDTGSNRWFKNGQEGWELKSKGQNNRQKIESSRLGF